MALAVDYQGNFSGLSMEHSCRYYTTLGASSRAVDTLRAMEDEALDTRTLAISMAGLPAFIRAKIRDHVLDMHRYDIVKDALKELWTEMCWYSRHDRWNQMLLDKKPSASFLLRTFDGINRDKGERAARDAIKEYAKRIVRKRLLKPSDVAYNRFALGVTWADFDQGRDVEREYRRVILKRNRLYRSVIGTAREYYDLNEQNLVVLED